MSGIILKPAGDLPLEDETQRMRSTLLYRLLLLPSALLLMAGGVAVHFICTANPVDLTDWLLALLAMAGTGVSFVGYWMAGKMATYLQMIDLETRQMRTQLMQACKMAELGEMSAGFVHQINNPLQVMISELALIQSITEDLASVVPQPEAQKMTMLKESTEVIGQQIKRCSRIAQGLLNPRAA